MAKPVPYDFVFDYLPQNIIVKPMFGMYYIYLNKKLVLMLRRGVNELHMNGIWVATLKEHHQSLQNDIPALSDFLLENGEIYDSGWRLLKDGDDDFESAAISLCDLISRGDRRIGKLTEKAPV